MPSTPWLDRPNSTKIAVLLACRNRVVQTRLALRSLAAAAGHARVETSIFLFDDGSSDGTADIAESEFGARVIRGDGTAYWARGMMLSERQATAEGDFDAVLWLNDDVVVDEDALLRAVRQWRAAPLAIHVGATRSRTGAPTYSGFRRRGIHPLSFERVLPGPVAQRVAAFNGNFVLIPTVVRESVGDIDGGYPHALADIDYGVRASRLGFPLLLMPGTVGVCEFNNPSRSNVIAEWRLFVGRKGGGNARAMARYIIKHHAAPNLAMIPLTYLLWWSRAAWRRR